MFKDPENLFSPCKSQSENFDRYSSYIPNLNNNYFHQDLNIPHSSLSSCSGDEESISPVNSGGSSSYYIGLNSSISDSDISQSKHGGCDRVLPTMSSSSPNQGIKCFGCGRTSKASAVVYKVSSPDIDQYFHTECLTCGLCKLNLSKEQTCYEKDGRILCKQDYYRLYHEASAKFTKKCARCSIPINASDLVMKCREFVYHVDCFVCTICQRAFNRGDHFRMNSTDLYCRLHYDMVEHFNTSEEPQEPGKSSANNKRGRPPKRKLLSGAHENLKDLEGGGIDYFHQKGPSMGLGKNEYLDSQPLSSPINSFNMSSLAHREIAQGGISPLDHHGPPQKGKRMRTTFKHNQLRVMKSYFEMNPNPDTKDLKQLSQKTGLCKRVLQVWFQNARAKHRRTCPRPESSLSGNGALQLDDSQEWSPEPQQTFVNSQHQQPLELSNLPLPLISG